MPSTVRRWSVRESLVARSLAICWTVLAAIGGFAAAAASREGAADGESVTTLTVTAAARTVIPATRSVSREGLRMNLC